MINPNLYIPHDKLPEFCRTHHIQELAVFGSATREDFRPDESDVDLLVTFDPDAKFGLLTYSRIASELSELFGRKVDLVEKRGLKPAIRESVLERFSTSCTGPISRLRYSTYPFVRLRSSARPWLPYTKLKTALGTEEILYAH